MQQPSQPQELMKKRVISKSDRIGTIEKIGSLSEKPFVLWDGNHIAISSTWENIELSPDLSLLK